MARVFFLRFQPTVLKQDRYLPKFLACHDHLCLGHHDEIGAQWQGAKQIDEQPGSSSTEAFANGRPRNRHDADDDYDDDADYVEYVDDHRVDDVDDNVEVDDDYDVYVVYDVADDADDYYADDDVNGGDDDDDDAED